MKKSSKKVSKRKLSPKIKPTEVTMPSTSLIENQPKDLPVPQDLVDLTPKPSGPIKVQMGNEPPAIIYFGGKDPSVDPDSIPLVKKGWVPEKKKV